MVKHCQNTCRAGKWPTLVFWIAGEFTGDPEVIPRTAFKVGFAVSSSAQSVVGLDAKLVINSVHDSLPGAKIPLRGLD